MTAVLEKNGARLIEKVEFAVSLSQRMVGLLGMSGLAPGSALFIIPCGSVHTFFMRFSLDLVFLDAHGRVTKVARNVVPWRVVWGGMRARGVLELSAGWLPADALKPGDVVTLSCSDPRSTGISPTLSRTS